MWDLSCPDWADRIRDGRSLIPTLPLNEPEADLALRMFDELQLPDVPGMPKMRDACGQWFREIVRVAFGSWFPDRQQRFIRDILPLLPKGQSKTTYVAALLLTGMLMNRRPRAEALFIGPTQAIAENAYDKAVGMIDASPDLKRRFRPRDHIKTIEDLVTHTELKIKTFDVNILTGTILFMAVLEELHLLGRNPHATKVLRQIRGGLEKTPEGLLIMPTTMPDEPPAGVFKDELKIARRIRNGDYRGKLMRPLLPILYEFPDEIAKDEAKWSDPANWPMVMPNLGRSVHLESLRADFASEKAKGEQAVRVWVSQHLNIEIGVGISHEDWAGTGLWVDCEDADLTLEALLGRSEVVVIGIDGGGLDDLLGLNVLGRCATTGDWLWWSKAWAHEIVLERRQEIAPRLKEFHDAGELTIVATPGEDVVEVVDIVMQIDASGKLAEKHAVGVDSVGITDIIEELAKRGFEVERIIGVQQGWKLTGAIKTTERRLAGKTLRHGPSALMNWVVGNAKVEMRGNAVLITKQVCGSAKIDPLMAGFNAVVLMGANPQPRSGSIYSDPVAYEKAFGRGADGASQDTPEVPFDRRILADPSHPDFAKHAALYEAWAAQQADEDGDF